MREVCPNCGAELPPRARACPECGSDEETGWSEEARSAELGLPDDSFDYDEFVKNEFGEKKPMRPRVGWLWWLVAVGLLLAFVVFWFRR